jgi:outer membrane protein OmpA-like peptidoglycan-associated protein
MADIKATLKALGAGIKLSTGTAHVVRLQPAPVARVRLTGMFFDTSKAFLLPSAVPGIKEIKNQYDAHPGSSLLLVGHTDTSGADQYNLDLSLERADSMAAYLTDKVDAWEAFFHHAADEKRWGVKEIQGMLSKLPDGQPPFFPAEPDGISGPQTDQAIRAFQSAKGMTVNGKVDAPFRKALIADYMAIDGTSLPGGISITTHGCGENFPAMETNDGARSPEDRRNEIFFFDGPIAPPPPGKTSKRGSKEYPQWVAQVTDTLDVSAAAASLISGCHLSFLLHSDLDDTPLANEAFTLTGAPSVSIQGKTDASGNLKGGDAEAGDFKLVIKGITMTVPAINKSEPRRRLRVRPDIAEA